MDDKSLTMKYNYIFLLSLFCFIMLCACKSDTKNNTSQTHTKTVQETPQKVVIKDTPKAVEKETTPEAPKQTIKTTPPPPPPIDEKKRKVIKELTNISPFLNSGCCKNEAKRQDDCCCDALLEQYKKMIADKDPKFVEYSMTDPILGACRKKKPGAFDAIENPTPETQDEDNLDDLF